MFRATPSIHRSYGLMRQTKILRLASHFAILNSLRRLPLAPAGSWPFPTLSLRILLHVSGPLPRLPLWCVYPFLPTELRPSQQSNPVGAQHNPYYSNFSMGEFRGCSHSLMFKPVEFCFLLVPPGFPNMNHLVCPCMTGGVGTGGEKPPATRFGKIVFLSTVVVHPQLSPQYCYVRVTPRFFCISIRIGLLRFLSHHHKTATNRMGITVRITRHDIQKLADQSNTKATVQKASMNFM